MEEATLRPLARTTLSLCHQSDGAITWLGCWRSPHQPQWWPVGQPDDRVHRVPVSQVEVTVARVVGFEIRGKAGGVEPGMVPVEQCAADAVVLPLRPHGQEREIVVRVK